MKIRIQDEDTHLQFVIPTSLICNRLATKQISKALNRGGLTISPEEAVQFAKILKEYKRHHKGWKLIEIIGADGSHLEITL